MGDTVYEYVMVGNSPPVTKYTAADAGQTGVMDNIEGAGDRETVIILDQPLVVENNSPTVEVGQSFISMVFKSSSIVERVLFEEADTRLAFLEFGLSQFAAIPVALGIPVQPETAWRNSQFEAATVVDRDAMNEIAAAPDIQTRILLRDPLIEYIRSPTVRVDEIVMFINFPNTTDAFRVYVGSVLNYLQFVQFFVIPLATMRAIGTNA